MNGDSTGAFMTVSLINTPPQTLDSALQELVDKNLRRRRIASAGPKIFPHYVIVNF